MNGNPFDDMASGGLFKDRLRDRVRRTVTRNQRGGERLRVRLGMMFRARGRLWLGMPAAAVVAFLLCFPLRMIDSPATEALTRGGIAAGVVALCWAIGIWASTGGPHSGEQAGRTGSEETDDADDLLSRWIDRLRQRSALAGRLLGLVLVFAALAAVCAPQLELLFSGAGQTVRALSGILLKVLAVGAVLLPIWLAARRGWPRRVRPVAQRRPRRRFFCHFRSSSGVRFAEKCVSLFDEKMFPNMKRIVVFTGAGVSADSGLATFRDSDGLWANYRIEDVCTPEALARNRALVIEFYNKRRREMLAARPNAAHEAIARLEQGYDVEVVTQNVDDLHERAGSARVTHLHGELRKLRSSRNPDLIVPLEGWEQPLDATAPDGSLLRPHIVFFGESVPMFERAAEIAQTADAMLVVGTSLAVYPAASLVRYVRPEIPIWVVDPGNPDTGGIRNPLTVIRKRAAEGVPELVDDLLRQAAK